MPRKRRRDHYFYDFFRDPYYRVRVTPARKRREYAASQSQLRQASGHTALVLHTPGEDISEGSRLTNVTAPTLLSGHSGASNASVFVPAMEVESVLAAEPSVSGFKRKDPDSLASGRVVRSTPEDRAELRRWILENQSHQVTWDEGDI